ncbi:MAG: TGS domain-containing protein [Anaerolineae bacterium]|nr:TGS domain-containing protein [Anaerolineae bacterium]
MHTEIGHRCRGARVNGKIVSLDYKLQTGDKVEIITAKRGGPSRDWLNPGLGYARTKRAASKIRQWFRKQDREKMIVQGRETVEREIKRVSSVEITLEEVAALFNYEDVEAFFAAVGFGDVSSESIATKILEAERQRRPDDLLAPVTTRQAPPTPRPAEGIDIMGTGGLLVHLARCCSPVVGEPIVGYITRGRGVTVHRADCPNVLNARERERLINVSWGEPTEQRFQVPVMINAYDRPGLLRDIAAVVADEHLSMSNVNTSARDNIVTFLVTMEITDLTQLGRVLYKISQIPNVIEARRRASS